MEAESRISARKGLEDSALARNALRPLAGSCMGTLNLSGKEEHDDCPVHQRESSGGHRRVRPGRQGHGATGLVIQRDSHRRGR